MNDVHNSEGDFLRAVSVPFLGSWATRPRTPTKEQGCVYRVDCATYVWISWVLLGKIHCQPTVPTIPQTGAWPSEIFAEPFVTGCVCWWADGGHVFRVFFYERRPGLGTRFCPYRRFLCAGGCSVGLVLQCYSTGNHYKQEMIQ